MEEESVDDQCRLGQEAAGPPGLGGHDQERAGHLHHHQMYGHHQEVVQFHHQDVLDQCRLGQDAAGPQDCVYHEEVHDYIQERGSDQHEDHHIFSQDPGNVQEGVPMHLDNVHEGVLEHGQDQHCHQVEPVPEPQQQEVPNHQHKENVPCQWSICVEEAREGAMSLLPDLLQGLPRQGAQPIVRDGPETSFVSAEDVEDICNQSRMRTEQRRLASHDLMHSLPGAEASAPVDSVRWHASQSPQKALAEDSTQSGTRLPTSKKSSRLFQGSLESTGQPMHSRSAPARWSLRERPGLAGGAARMSLSRPSGSRSETSARRERRAMWLGRRQESPEERTARPQRQAAMSQTNPASSELTQTNQGGQTGFFSSSSPISTVSQSRASCRLRPESERAVAGDFSQSGMRSEHRRSASNNPLPVVNGGWLEALWLEVLRSVGLLRTMRLVVRRQLPEEPSHQGLVRHDPGLVLHDPDLVRHDSRLLVTIVVLLALRRLSNLLR